jgi:hypothetical protein
MYEERSYEVGDILVRSGRKVVETWEKDTPLFCTVESVRIKRFGTVGWHLTPSQIWFMMSRNYGVPSDTRTDLLT